MDQIAPFAPGWRTWLALASLAALALAAAGPAPGAAPAVSRAVVLQSSDPTSLDPHNHRETPTGNVARHLYDPLLFRDPRSPTRFIPVLATTWYQVNETTYEFTLKPGVRFANGEPFNAEAVKFTIDRVLGRTSERAPLNAYAFTTLRGAEAVDELTVRIITKAPDPVLLSRLSTLYIVPPRLTREQGRDGLQRNPAGTGPYVLKSFVPNDRLVLEAKPTYHMGRPRIDEVVFRGVAEAATRNAELRAGNADVIVNVPPDSIEEITSSGRATVKSVPSTRVAIFFLNTLEYPQFRDRRVRQALNYAVDVDSIVKHVMRDYGLRVPTIVAPYFTGYNPNLKPYPFDAERAKRLLAEAGYANGFDMEILVPQGRYLLGVEAAQAIAGYLNRVGIRTRLNVVEFGVFAKTTQERKIKESMYAAWGNALFNPLDAYKALVVTGSDAFSWYSNKQVDELYQKAASTADLRRHTQYLQQMEELIYQDPPFIFLFAQKDLYGVSNRLNWEPRQDEVIFMYEGAVR
jgi:peptide/nickel transport system substrate-binding protein